MNETVHFSDLSLADFKEGFLESFKTNISKPIEGIFTIGRDPENSLVLEDPYVSSKHCQIEKRPHGFFIRDLKSRNGIRVNGLRISEGQLSNGTEIQIGSHDFVFKTQKPHTNQSDLPLKSKNPEWMNQLTNLPHLATTEIPIFLQGESGTGKEVLAHILHDHSQRHDCPFISVNCGALSESLVESELFGHVRGSFTGATNDRKGAFEAARGGTLFLDEIGDLPLSLQPKLLRAIENQEIKPVGSDKVVSTDVRLVTATHKNLEALVAEGKFRGDLYFRINVVRVQIPPLRSRMEDFEDLLYLFCREMRVRFSVQAIEEMKKHKWSGNIRELKNAVSRAKAHFPQTQIRPEHLSQIITAQTPPEFRPTPSISSLSEIINSNRPPHLKDIEREMIISRLIANKGNQRRTASELGMPKSTLHDRLKAYNIDSKSLMDI